MFKTLMDRSSAVSCLKYLYKKYRYIVESIIKIYQDSHIFIWQGRFLERIRVYFGYSFLTKISQIKEERDLVILDNSKSMQYIINLYRRYNVKLSHCFTTSSLLSFTRKIKEEIYFAPLKAIGIILITAVMTNTFLSVILRKNILLWDWILRSLLLLVVVGSLFSGLGWQTLKENSFILKLITKK